MTDVITPEEAALTQVRALVLPKRADLSARALGALVQIDAFVIDSQDMKELAVDELQALMRGKQALEAQKEKITKPLHEAHIAAVAMFKPALELYERGEQMWKSKILAYDRAAAEADRVRQAAAQKLIDDERARLEAIAREKAAQAEAEAAAGNAEAASVAQQEAEAAAMTSAVMVAPTATVRVATKGVSTRKAMKWREVDHNKFVVAVAAMIAAGDVGAGKMLVADSRMVGNRVKETGLATNIPGIEVYEDTGLAVRK